ncbi:MAG: HAD-IA family hydrolase [Paracoccaceae bacterium]|nr:HAD-IA family hydrolase [Paracoccaceae bacterium]
MRLVMFDMDGTLLDSQDFIVEAMRRAFSQMELPDLGRAEILSIVGLSLDHAISTLMPDLKDREVSEATNLYKQNFIALRAEKGGEGAAPLYPDVRETLEILSQDNHLLMGVATGNARRGLDHAYSSHNLGSFFVTHQTADNHPSKPNPSMLITALQETGTDVANAVMIGDTQFDMEMAKAAGYHAIGVNWGYHPVERLSAADHILSTMSDLPDYLAAHWETVR